jgi:hypothetical protein
MATLTALRDLKDALLSCRALPTRPVEPTACAFVVENPLGGIVAPPSLYAPDVVVRTLPRSVRSGTTLRLHVAVVSDFPYSNVGPNTVSTTLATHLCVIASLEAPCTSPLPVAPTYSIAYDGRGCVVALDVPPDTPADAELVIIGVSVAGQPVSGFPTRLRVTAGLGLKPPVTICGVSGTSCSTPALSREGALYIPYKDRVYTVALGTRQADRLASLFGLSADTRAAACCDATGTLLLGDCTSAANSTGSIVAVDPVTSAVKWRVQRMSGFAAVAALPLHARCRHQRRALCLPNA